LLANAIIATADPTVTDVQYNLLGYSKVDQDVGKYNYFLPY